MKKKLTACALLTVAAVLALAANAYAHDTWLFPTKTNVPVGTKLKLDLTSGMAFPANASSIDPARLQTSMVRLKGDQFPMSRHVLAKKALRLEATLPKRGVAALWITLKPRTLELTPSQIQEYIEEIGAADSIRALYPAGGKNPSWREQYTKEAKTFVTVGPPDADTSWKIPVGMSFEFVPLSDPRTIHAGDKVDIRLFRDGKPLANFPVGDVTERKTTGRLTRTNANGIVTLVAPTQGRWLLRATDLRRPAARNNADWESVFTTLTLAVNPRSKP